MKHNFKNINIFKKTKILNNHVDKIGGRISHHR